MKFVMTSLLCVLMGSGVRAQKKKVMTFASNTIVAHRGAWKKNGLPQNSIASLKLAGGLGCTGSEFDVQLTADDSLVINHDPEYAGKAIEKHTFAELTATPLANGEKLPTLRTYLLVGMEHPHTRLVLEIKPSAISKERALTVTEKVVALVNELKAGPWVTYISFDYDVVKRVHALLPKAPVQYLNGDKSPGELMADGISGADYHYSVFQQHPEWITDARRLGVVLNAWTVNDAAIMDWLIGLKFDLITTNEPELLLERYAAVK